METRRALRVGLYGGCLALLVDLDHAYALFYQIYFHRQFDELRILHPLFFIIASLFICYLVAHLGRLYFKRFLSNKR